MYIYKCTHVLKIVLYISYAWKLFVSNHYQNCTINPYCYNAIQNIIIGMWLYSAQNKVAYIPCIRKKLLDDSREYISCCLSLLTQVACRFSKCTVNRLVCSISFLFKFCAIFSTIFYGAAAGPELLFDLKKIKASFSSCWSYER